MPIYEYHCGSCEHDFEELVGLKESSPACPLCDHEVERIISLSTFRLKGDGWYADAYAGKSNKAPGAREKE